MKIHLPALTLLALAACSSATVFAKEMKQDENA